MTTNGSLPNPAHVLAPKYWRNEASGKLEGPMLRYINNEGLSCDDILYIRAYLRQWIDSPAWDMNTQECDEGRRILAELRTRVRSIKNRLEIDQWIWLAVEWGLDPL